MQATVYKDAYSGSCITNVVIERTRTRRRVTRWHWMIRSHFVFYEYPNTEVVVVDGVMSLWSSPTQMIRWLQSHHSKPIIATHMSGGYQVKATGIRTLCRFYCLFELKEIKWMVITGLKGSSTRGKQNNQHLLFWCWNYGLASALTVALTGEQASITFML